MALLERNANHRASQPDLFGSTVSIAPRFDLEKITKIALGIWRVSDDPRDFEIARRWFTSQRLELTADIACSVVRFHSSLKFGETRAPVLIFLLRDVFTDEPCAIFRVYVDDDGRTVGRKVLGRTYKNAIKLTADVDVGTSLHLASSVETGIAALNSSIRPVWAVVGANAVADFPVLPGIKTLSVISAQAQPP